MPATQPTIAEAARAFAVVDYDLAVTLTSGQAFRWSRTGSAWEGVIGPRWVRLSPTREVIRAEVAQPVTDWDWLREYLQLDCSFADVLDQFPPDPPLQRAVDACRGLRLLRQDVWECLASFILSSTKRIEQIQQVVARLCERYGDPVTVPAGVRATRAFPTAARLAVVPEGELRKCGMGFRAPYLAETARIVAAGGIALATLRERSLPDARAELMRLPGVGRKIADCVLLFAVGHATAFPVDVWVLKTLRETYFDGREVPLREVVRFTEARFGPQAGYAQQYLFHAARTRAGQSDQTRPQ